MFDALRKAVLFGAGLAVMTTEKMKDFAEELVKRGEMSEKAAPVSYTHLTLPTIYSV